MSLSLSTASSTSTASTAITAIMARSASTALSAPVRSPGGHILALPQGEGGVVVVDNYGNVVDNGDIANFSVADDDLALMELEEVEIVDGVVDDRTAEIAAANFWSGFDFQLNRPV